MDYIPNINVKNIKDFHDQYTLIDLLKAGYKQSLTDNENTKKLLQKNDNFSDFQYARWSALSNSFHKTIVLLEQLEKQFEKLDMLQDQAEEGVFFYD